MSLSSVNKKDRSLFLLRFLTLNFNIDDTEAQVYVTAGKFAMDAVENGTLRTNKLFTSTRILNDTEDLEEISVSQTNSTPNDAVNGVLDPGALHQVHPTPKMPSFKLTPPTHSLYSSQTKFLKLTSGPSKGPRIHTARADVTEELRNLLSKNGKSSSVAPTGSSVTRSNMGKIVVDGIADADIQRKRLKLLLPPRKNVSFRRAYLPEKTNARNREAMRNYTSRISSRTEVYPSPGVEQDDDDNDDNDDDDDDDDTNSQAVNISGDTFQQGLRTSSQLLKNDIHNKCTISTVNSNEAFGGIRDTATRNNLKISVSQFLQRLLQNSTNITDPFSGDILEEDIRTCLPFQYRESKVSANASDYNLSMAESIHLIRLVLKMIVSPTHGNNIFASHILLICSWKSTGIVSILPIIIFEKNPFVDGRVQRKFSTFPLGVVYPNISLKEGEFNFPVWEKSSRRSPMDKIVGRFVGNLGQTDPPADYALSKQKERYDISDTKHIWERNRSDLKERMRLFKSKGGGSQAPITKTEFDRMFVFRCPPEKSPMFPFPSAKGPLHLYSSSSNFVVRFSKSAIDALIRKFRKQIAKRIAMLLLFDHMNHDSKPRRLSIEPYRSTSQYGNWKESFVQALKREGAFFWVHRAFYKFQIASVAESSTRILPFDDNVTNQIHGVDTDYDIIPYFERAFESWCNNVFMPETIVPGVPDRWGAKKFKNLDDTDKLRNLQSAQIAVALVFGDGKTDSLVPSDIPPVFRKWMTPSDTVRIFECGRRNEAPWRRLNDAEFDVYQFGRINNKNANSYQRYRCGVYFDGERARLASRKDAIAKSVMEYSDEKISRTKGYLLWRRTYYYAWQPESFWKGVPLPEGFSVAVWGIAPEQYTINTGHKSNVPSTHLMPPEKSLPTRVVPLNHESWSPILFKYLKERPLLVRRTG